MFIGLITSSSMAYYKSIVRYYGEIMIKLIIRGYWIYVYCFIISEGSVIEDLLLGISSYWDTKFCYEYNDNINALWANMIFNKVWIVIIVANINIIRLYT